MSTENKPSEERVEAGRNAAIRNMQEAGIYMSDGWLRELVSAVLTAADAVLLHGPESPEADAKSLACNGNTLGLDHAAGADAAGAQQAAPSDEATRKLVERCRDALAEELGAWDIDPPLFHVKEAHDACVAWLSAPAPAAPFAWVWRRKGTDSAGIYFEDPARFTRTDHPDYEWHAVYTHPAPAPAEAVPAGWMPIETAKRDEQVLLSSLKGGVFIGRWRDFERINQPQITHWQPLPPPPSQPPSAANEQKGGA